MLRSLLRRTAVGVLGFAAVLFSVFGTQATEVAAQDIFTRVGCTYGDYACYYNRTGVATQGYAVTSYQPFGYNTGYNNFGYNSGYNTGYNTFNYQYAGFNNAYTPAFYSNAYIPAFNNNNQLFFNGSYYPSNYGNRTYFGYRFGGVPDRFFTSVGCNVGNYTCLFNKT